MDTFTVFLAIRSPVWRAHLRATLRQTPGARLLGSVHDAEQAAEALAILRPDLVLGDEEALTGLPAAAGSMHGARLVLVTASPLAAPVGLRRAVAGSLLLTATPAQVAAAARAILGTPAPSGPPYPSGSPAPAQPASDRPGVAGPTTAAFAAPRTALLPGSQPPSPDGPRPRSSAATRLQARLAPEGVAPAAEAQDHAPGARTPGADVRARDVALDRLRAQVAAVGRDRGRYPPDAASGLPGMRSFEQALGIVAGAGRPATIVVAELQGARGRSPHEVGLLRRASASLRAHVRPEDLICHGGGAQLVLLLPGLERPAAPARAERLRAAAALACGAGAGIAVAAEVCEAGQEPRAALARCLAALRAT